jgi:thymidylate synthase
LGFNIASYGLLLELLADEMNMVPDQLIGNLGDVHIYEEHYDAVREQLSRGLFPLPKLKIAESMVSVFANPEYYDHTHFELVSYQHHPKLTAPLK